MNPVWVPRAGQTFRNLDDAWSFWINYGGCVGFDVKKRYTIESKYDGKATSSRYVCAKKGRRALDKRDRATKTPELKQEHAAQLGWVFN